MPKLKFAFLDIDILIQGDDKEKGKGEGKGAGAKKALKNLLKSGIPGIEGMFGAEPPAPR